jgi:agmatinase
MATPTFDPGAAAAPGSGIYGLPHTPDEAHVVLVPVPWEATTSYGGGAAEGPRAILAASHQVDLFDVETGRPYEAGIALLPEEPKIRRWNREARRAAAPVIAAGGPATPALLEKLSLVNDRSVDVDDWVYETASAWMDRGKLVGLVGGDHSCPLGAIRAAAERHADLGVLHLDAHADLRRAYEGFVGSHASIFYNVCEDVPVKRLVQVGVRDLSEEEFEYARASGGRIVQHLDADLFARRFDGVPWAKQVDLIVRDLPEEVWLSFDIDGLDPTLCPGTGTPVPGGLSFPEACALVAGVARSGRRIVGFDLCEVAPSGEGDEWDGNVGARLLYKMIGWALVSEREAGKPRKRGAARKTARAAAPRARGR